MTVSEIVISGVAGRFPKSDNVMEFEKNLSNGVYMVGDPENRIKWKMPNQPTKFGLIRNLEKFDAQVFRVPTFATKSTDPQARILLEHVWEAISDAGVSPSSLMGSNTGVYVGCLNYDSLDYWLYDKTTRNGMSSFGNSPYAMANRVSFALGLRGPSIAVDTACSSSISALNYAFIDIRLGNCDAAIVAGTNLILSPKPTEDFSLAGVLTKTGISQPFDKNASGYVRAEACGVVFLQKVVNAKRVYATLVNIKVNNDGYKTEGPTVPSAEVQQQLYQSVYENIDVAAESVDYIEAHATSTQVGDKKEVTSIDEFFCRKRSFPLKVGSVKSNIGHAEGAAGITSLVKSLLMFENEKVYPNLNISELRDDCPALVENRIEIVQNVAKFDGKLIGISSFGVNGSNAHALIKRNEKVKVNNGLPSDNFPCLLTWAGRTLEAVDTIFDHVASKSIDDEFLALLQSTQIKSNQTCLWRGFAIFQSNVEDHSTIVVDRQVQESDGVKRPIVFLFSGVGSHWQKMGRDLMKIPPVAEKIEQCHQILLAKKINLKDILTSDDPKIFSNCTNIFVGVAAIQIALTDLMRLVGVDAEHFIGHSVGELGCAYADGTLTMEETILAAYSRGLAITDVKREPGAMAAIGLGYNELKNIIPESIEVACHNSSESCTITGKLEPVKKFVDEVKSKNVFAKIVDSAQVPFHSSYIAESGPLLLDRLNSIITMPKNRSNKWISTSIPKDQWDNELAQFSSADYHTNNMLSPVLFEEGMLNLPERSFIIEIAPHGLLQSVSKKCLPNCDYVSLTKRGIEDGVIFLLQSLGKIYQTGIDIDICQIYPKIEFPVSRGTEMIAPLIRWNHNENLFVPMHDPFTQSDKRCLQIKLSDTKYNYLKGHSIGGRVILPAAGYLCFVWETFAIMHCQDPEDLPVCFEEVTFLRATVLTSKHATELTVNIQRGTGNFEVIEGPTTVVSGKIKLSEDEKLRTISIGQIDEEVSFSLDHSGYYKELRLRGYDYSNDFKSVKSMTQINNHQVTSKIEWTNWVTFIDGIFQMFILTQDSRDLFVSTSVAKVTINPQLHREFLERCAEVQNENEAAENGNPDHDEKKKKIILELKSDLHTKTMWCGGVEVVRSLATVVNNTSQAVMPTLETYKFVPHFPTPTLSTLDAAHFCVQLFLESSPTLKLNVVEVDDGAEALIEAFANYLDKIPMVTSDITYLTKKVNIEIANVKICKDDDLKSFNCVNILIMKNALKKSDEDLKLIFEKIDKSGVLLSREELEEENLKVAEICQCIAIVTLDRELIYVIRKKKIISGEVIVEIPSDISNLEWIQQVKDEVYKKNIVIRSHSDGSSFSGILGFFNCLCKEPNVKNLRCVLVEDDVTNIEQNQSYRDQLALCLPVNILKNGKWGTYRHLSFSSNAHDMSPTKHAFVNLLTRGDVSSLKWIHGDSDVSSDKVIKVHYCALNYRDVLIATKRIMLDFEMENRIERQYMCGFEFSGVTKDGKRLNGLVKSKGIANYITLTDDHLAIEIPNQWSLEEAATVPLVYVTVYSAFFYYTEIERGKSILIHAGSGGVGIAAIRVALGYGMRVFTTVSTDEKKHYLLNEFSELDADDIGNSRDCTFETMVMTRTNGKGVNYVLNSLADDKMHASIRCLADNGVFLEVGKIDMLIGSKISLSHFLRGIQFKAVQFKLQEFKSGKESLYMKKIVQQMENDMKSGIIKPIRATVFAANEIEKAIRFMAKSKHIGKILINVNEVRESTEENPSTPLQVLPRVYFDQSKSYIIPGGLGGMGMEIADWMILRNCKKLVLSSRRGISSSYQAYRIKIWKSYDVEVVVSTANISTREGCEELVKKAMEMGPVGGIFILSGVISDGLFENLDVESFEKVFRPKAWPAIYLDEVSRILCPVLDHFVTFSSVSCGYGNAGQTNYGFANSVTEKVIEKRQRDKLPAKAVQWGPIDDVGMLKEGSEDKELTSSFFGLIPQKISSCFDSMNAILSSTETIISSVVVAEKQRGFTNKKNFFATMMTAMGVLEISSIDRNKAISALGLDSLGGTEIQQILEREFGISLTFQELRSKTLNMLDMLINGSNKNVKVQNMTSLMDSMWRNLQSGMGNGELIEPIKCIEGKKPKILLIPGMIGNLGSAWKELDYSIYILQHIKFYDLKSFDELLDSIFGEVMELFKDDDEFILVGYSFGSAIALRICEIFESMGKCGKIIFVDGSPHYIKNYITEKIPCSPTDRDIQHLIFHELSFRTYGAMADEVLKNVYAKSTWLQKVDEFLKSITDFQSKKFMENNLESLLNRLRMVLEDEFNYKASANIKVLLIKPIDVSSKISDDDYGLRDYCDGDIRIESVIGDHYTLIDSKREIVDAVNLFLS